MNKMREKILNELKEINKKEVELEENLKAFGISKEDMPVTLNALKKDYQELLEGYFHSCVADYKKFDKYLLIKKFQKLNHYDLNELSDVDFMELLAVKYVILKKSKNHYNRFLSAREYLDNNYYEKTQDKNPIQEESDLEYEDTDSENWYSEEEEKEIDRYFEERNKCCCKSKEKETVAEQDDKSIQFNKEYLSPFHSETLIEYEDGVLIKTEITKYKL